METITPVPLGPWRARLKTLMDKPSDGWTIAVAVSSSARNGTVGAGGIIQSTATTSNESKREVFSFTLGARTGQNPFAGELAAIAYALRNVRDAYRQNIVISTRNKAAVAALNRPHQQSGQEFIKCIYDSVGELADKGNTVVVSWESPDKNKLLHTAKKQAKAATEQGAVPHAPFPVMKSTLLYIEQRKLTGERSIPEGVGRFTKTIDTAIPGDHTQKIYEEHSWKERSTLAQLRTDMGRLNGYLHRIKATSSGQCACGEARETVEHFLLHCPQWDEQRTGFREDASTKWDDLSFRLGGKSPTDGPKWKPNLGAVRATIQFTLATGRFDY